MVSHSITGSFAIVKSIYCSLPPPSITNNRVMLLPNLVRVLPVASPGFSRVQIFFESGLGFELHMDCMQISIPTTARPLFCRWFLLMLYFYPPIPGFPNSWIPQFPDSSISEFPSPLLYIKWKDDSKRSQSLKPSAYTQAKIQRDKYWR